MYQLVSFVGDWTEHKHISFKTVGVNIYSLFQNFKEENFHVSSLFQKLPKSLNWSLKS